ncbi:glycosyltransferase [Streptomyces sp. NPDC014864]|uniref:glycosyltransferase n=1 Tax=Streptomyces sp. NPDC014864 TaxID=3364924 RepID=UPI0036F649F9
MTRGHEADLIPGLDGAERQGVAHRLWQGWRVEGRGAAVLTGMPGVGKTQAVVAPLLAKAAREGAPTVCLDVPFEAADVNGVLVSRLVEELVAGGHRELAETIPSNSDFATAAREVLRAGALVVVDEFQRLLDAGGHLRQAWFRGVERLAKRPPDGGCLWLVSNRLVDADWTESFHVEELPIPEADDATRIVLKGLTAQDTDARFPVGRRVEVIRRLGANPRALRLLGFLLKKHSLDDLLPPAAVLPKEPARMQLVEDIERRLLAKAAEGLPAETRAFLRDLSILREWAPWKLVETMGGDDHGDIEPRMDELLERYLMTARAPAWQSDSGPHTLYQVHPLVREVDGVRMQRDEAAWREAHRRAGEWYARPLYAASNIRTRDLVLAGALSNAQFHLTEAAADDVFADAMRSVHGYMEHRYGWSASRPSSDEERDARIALLRAYLTVSGGAAAHYHLATLLRDRAGHGELAEALRHAERSTAGQDHAIPWVLWVQLVRAVEGLEAAVPAARKAAASVAPSKSLFSIYQLLGASLCALGRADEAVKALRKGTGHTEDQKSRLAEAAIRIAAAEPTDDLLNEVIGWLRQPGWHIQLCLARSLSAQRHGRWREAAELAAEVRAQAPAYLALSVHEAMGWLGAGEARRAQAALDKYPSLRLTTGNVNTWLAAAVALQNGDLPRASHLLGTYLGSATPPTAAEEIRSVLLGEWDQQVGKVGAANPAYEFPVLPPTLTGLAAVVTRPQYGDPVLPRDQKAGNAPMSDDRLRFLVLATEWSSAHGGLSTFNRQLCTALAAAGTQVFCVVLQATPGEYEDAAAKGVRLIQAQQTPGVSDTQRLFRKPALPNGADPDFIVGHGRITGPAAHHLGDAFPHARRLHFIHMIPDDIERLKLDRGEDVGRLAEERQQIELELSTDAHRVVVVGPRMYNWFLRDLQARGVDKEKVLRFDPGFDADTTQPRTPPLGAPWMTLLFGRAEDHRLKGLDLAARAFSLAQRRRAAGTTAVELLVRGAPEGESGALEKQMRDWAEDAALSVRVSPYSTQHERLAADLKAASLVLMPSRSEGFGLVGVEAIVAGAPVLVSSASGLGELLRELLSPDEAARVVVTTTRDDVRDVTEWGHAIEAVLRDREAAFTWAAKLQSRLAGLWTWSQAVSGLLDSCGQDGKHGQSGQHGND